MKRMGVEETRVPPTSRLTALRAPAAAAAVQDSLLYVCWGRRGGTSCCRRNRERLPILEMTHTAADETGRGQFEVFTGLLANTSLKDNGHPEHNIGLFPRLTGRDVFCWDESGIFGRHFKGGLWTEQSGTHKHKHTNTQTQTNTQTPTNTHTHTHTQTNTIHTNTDTHKHTRHFKGKLWSEQRDFMEGGGGEFGFGINPLILYHFQE